MSRVVGWDCFFVGFRSFLFFGEMTNGHKGVGWVPDPLLFMGRWWIFIRMCVSVAVGKEMGAMDFLRLLVEKGVFRTRVGTYLQRVCLCRGWNELGMVYYGIYVGDKQRVKINMGRIGDRIHRMDELRESLVELISSDTEMVGEYVQAGRFSLFGGRMMKGKMMEDCVVVDLKDGFD